MSQTRRLSAVEQRLIGPGRAPARTGEAPVAEDEKTAAERSLHEFVRQAWSQVESAPFVDGWHIECVTDHLQSVTEGRVENLLINIPPGHSKSITTSVLWPCWEWARDPSIRFFFASYDQRLSTRDSVKCRALINSAWYQQRWGDRFQLADDQNQKTYFETDKGGYRLASSVGGHGMGQHPDRIVIDDPHDPHGAESEAELQSAIEWWTLTLSTRGISRGVRRCIIMQRLSEGDLSGHVLSEGDFVHVCLPLRFEAGRMPPSPVRDRHGRPWQDRRAEEGELLAPKQFPEKAVQAMERRLGSFGVAGQCQQRPAPRGGALFKRAWFTNRCRYELRDGAVLIRQGKPTPVMLNSCSVFAVVDGGASSKTTSDPTVISVFAASQDGDIFVLWVIRARLEVEEVVPVLDDVARAWRPDWTGIEANGFQIWFVREARDKARFPYVGTVHELQPEGKSKAVRAAPAIIRAEAGSIYVPFEADATNPWTGPFLEELFSFTGREGRADDQVDCLSYAVLSVDRLGLAGGCLEESELPFALEERPHHYQDRRYY